MKMSKHLYKLVVKEADNIKKYATEDEISKLNLYYLDGNRVTKCIYGQMTGHCISKRAAELINLCSEKRLNSKSRWVKQQRTVLNSEFDSIPVFSPIEASLFDLCSVDQKQVARYIKGECESIEFIYEKNYK